jgi:hypothetical protein
MNSSKSGLTIPNLLILCGSVVLGAIVICAIIFLAAAGGLENLFASNNSGKTKREDVSIVYDGVTFNLSSNFGKTIRNLAKNRKAFDYDVSISGRNTPSLDVEQRLNTKYDYNDTRIGFLNKKEDTRTFIISNDADHFEHDDEYKIGDTDTESLEFYVKKGETAKIDKITIKYGTTTEADLLKSFNDIKTQDIVEEMIGQDDYHLHYLLAKYKGWYIYIQFEEKNERINIGFKKKPSQRF